MKISWRPQRGPQKALIDCPIYEIFYGGARGGGKTDGVLGKMALKAGRYGPGFNCVFYRKELPMLDDAIERSDQIYGPIGGKWVDYKKTWRFPDGGRLRFRPLETIKDADKYQGQNLSDVCVEEAGNYGDPRPIQRLHAALRSSTGVPTQMHLTGNPGGPGQFWLKERFIDPAPLGFKIIRETLPNGQSKSRIFIPARVGDNRILLKNDPDYVGGLYLVGSKALVKAWLEGDFDAVEGAYFDCWDTEKHVIRPFEIPAHWVRFRSFDWGSAKPFSVGWWAVANEDTDVGGKLIPRGAIIRYREWYGASSADVGLKMRVEDIAKGIKEREADEKIDYGVADPALWKEDGGPSQKSRMSQEGVYFRKADNQRVPGWDQVRARLIGEDDKPMIYFFSTCRDAIRTLPAMQHDKNRPEDVDTKSEDHAPDEIRYACMSNPWTRTIEVRKPKDRYAKAFEARSENTWKTA